MTKFDPPKLDDPTISHYLVTDLDDNPVFQSHFLSSVEEWLDDHFRPNAFRLYVWDGDTWVYRYRYGTNRAFE